MPSRRRRVLSALAQATVTVVFGLIGAAVLAADARDQASQLVAAALPAAIRQLESGGGLRPLALEMAPDGSIIAVEAPGEQLAIRDAVRMLEQKLRADASAGRIIASLIAYPARFPSPVSGLPTDAIALAVDHREHYSAVILHPYTLVDGKVTLGDPVRRTGDGMIFAH